TRIKLVLLTCSLLLFSTFLTTESIVFAEEEKEDKQEEKKDRKEEDEFKLPKNVISLSKANTFPNTIEHGEVIEPSSTTKELLDELKIDIENPDLIKLLNESTIKPSPIAIGYRANVFLGRWPLNYKSENTSVNWDYQKINENKLDNVGGDDVQEIRYVQ